jgi:hypothetical protein
MSFLEGLAHSAHYPPQFLYKKQRKTSNLHQIAYILQLEPPTFVTFDNLPSLLHFSLEKSSSPRMQGHILLLIRDLVIGGQHSSKTNNYERGNPIIKKRETQTTKQN